MAHYNIGDTLRNRNGTDYFVTEYSHSDDEVMLVTKGGYYFAAHGIHHYDDGTVEWNSSGHGRFLPQVEKRYQYADCANYLAHNYGKTGNTVNTACVGESIEKYGFDTTAYVISADICGRNYDDRIDIRTRLSATQICNAYLRGFGNEKWFWSMPEINSNVHSSALASLLQTIIPQCERELLITRIAEIKNHSGFTNAELLAPYLAVNCNDYFGLSEKEPLKNAERMGNILSDLTEDEVRAFEEKTGINHLNFCELLDDFIENEKLARKLTPPDGVLSREQADEHGIYKNDMYAITGGAAQKIPEESGVIIYDIWEHNSDFAGNIEAVIPREKIDNDEIYGVSLRQWNYCQNHNFTAQKPMINADVNPEILPLFWNRKENIAYLGVNAAAFPDGADLLEYHNLCAKFGIYKCENYADLARVETVADRTRLEVCNFKTMPSLDFMRTYSENRYSEVYGFQTETAGYPLKIGCSTKYGLIWIEPSVDEVDFIGEKTIAQPFGEAMLFCEKEGVKSWLGVDIEAEFSRFGGKSAYDEWSAAAQTIETNSEEEALQ